MDHNTTYNYGYQPRQRSPSTASSKSSGAYQNSSAFSASANPDEDWTKISDLAERRRIQNRIAQRNYRKKLKRRLEDLERRTTSSSASPEQSHSELVKAPANELNIPGQQTMQRRASAPRTGLVSQEQQYSSNLMSSDTTWMHQMSGTKSTYPLSMPSTHMFSESYPSTAEYFPEDFSSTPYTRMPTVYANSAYPTDYPQSVSPSMPTISPNGSYKADLQYGSADLLTPFNMNYASLAGLNVPTTQGSSEFPARTPPLTASSLYFDPSDCSPPQFALPMTPKSRSVSPNIVFFDHIEV